MDENNNNEEELKEEKKSGWVWNGRPWQAFKNIAVILSFAVNIILIIVLLIVAPLIIPIVADIVVPLVDGLDQSFVKMGEAEIVRTIDVEDEIPIEFVLPLRETTTVTLTQKVPLASVPTTFVLPGGGGQINGSVNLELPAGLALPVELSVDVPVSTTIPVALAVDVEIPLDETDLGEPFGDLQAIFNPLNKLLQGLPSSNDELIERVKEATLSNEPEGAAPAESP